MPAFDGVIKTRTRVSLGRDSFQPNMGLLGKASKTEEALIHGNQKLKVDINVTEEITGNYDLKIKGTSTTQIRGDVTAEYLGNFDLLVNRDTTLLFAGKTGETYMDLRTERMVSAHNTHNVGPKMSVFTAPLTESHASLRQISEPAVRMSVIGQELTLQANSSTIASNAAAVYGTLVQAAGAQVQAAGASLQPIGANIQVNGASVAFNGFNTAFNIGFLNTTPLFVWGGASVGPNSVM